MDAERWRNIEDLFFGALDHEGSARAAFLDAQCNGDAELRKEVEGMLAAEEKAAARLAGVVGGTVRSLADTVPAGSHIGPYQILTSIGEGGMGVVYRARRSDDVFKKDVAIKVVKRGMDTDAILCRFRHERRILASLEHPYIARVLDGGSTEGGLPYLVMEYVDGQPVTAYSNQLGLGLHERLQLFQKICEAVEHAHRNLIVHRDLKPSNILVDTQGHPRLLDFGIAKILDETDSALLLTTINQRLFTPAYASPEQVKGEPVTVASDVYCLGLVLYELLTGCAAQTLQAATPAATLKAVCEEEIRPPSQAARLARSSGSAAPVAPERLGGDLDRIVLMAVEKEPRLRYGSVEQLASDIRNFQESRPILARPQTVRYRTVKFVRRHRGALAAAAVIVLSLLGGIAYSTYQARRAEARFQQVRKLANTFVFDVDDAIQPLAGSTKARQLLVSTGLEYLDSLAAEAGGDPDLQLDLAQAYIKLGNVQGAPRAGPHLGDTAGALASHRKAINLLDQLVQTRPDDLKVFRSLATSNRSVGDLEVHAGNRPQALSAYSRAIEIAHRVVAHPQHEPADIRLLGLALVSVGNQQLAQGESAAAVISLEAAVENFRSFAKAASFAEGQRSIAYGLQYLGQAYGGHGDIELAAQTYRQAIAVREEIARRDPKNLAPRRELAVAYSLLADQLFSPLQFSVGKHNEALPLYRQALAICEEGVVADPSNMRAQRDLSLGLLDMARALEPENPEEALGLTQRAEAVVGKVARDDRANAETQRIWANTFSGLASRLQALGRLLEAVEAAERSLRMMEPLTPKLIDARRDSTDIHHLIGDVRLQMHDFDGARQHYAKSLELAQQFQTQMPRDLFALRQLANSQERMGRLNTTVASNRGTPSPIRQASCQEARTWFQKSLDTWGTWGEKGGSGNYPELRKEKIIAQVPACN